uniref:Dihydrolipoyllysine-residue succinyltransferase component of 2-oxoglutarate dehydrogenase complex, mitochondrial n=1 Tax=Hirondellea gigas TaxID=1518452 RepID=A0A2P2HW51_9CRUS
MLGFRNLSRCCSRIPPVKHQIKFVGLRPALASPHGEGLPPPAAAAAALHTWTPCRGGMEVERLQHPRRHRRYLHSSAPLGGEEVVHGVVPSFADSISEGDLRWVKAVGDHVSQDETVCEIETDKTTVPVNSPCAGVVAALLVEEGATVTPGTQIFTVKPGEAGEAAAAPAAEAPAAAPAAAAAVAATAAAAVATKAPPPSPPPAPAAAPMTPPPAKVSMPVAAIQHSSFIHQAQVKVPPQDYSKDIAGTRTEQRVKLSRMRLRIAARLKEAQNTCAMLTTFNEVDMSNIMELRKSIGDQFFKRHGIKLGLMSAFVKGSAYALTRLPVVNAVIDNNEIIYRDYVDISVAVASPKGLLVPVIRNVEEMDYLTIERSIAALGEKARNNAIAVEDMDGGTFTISNGGVFGSMFGTPIINPPQSAILGMHGIFDRPVARGGQVVVRPMMYIALTYDHRLIDGREAVTFLKQIKSSVEDPRTMLCGL